MIEKILNALFPDFVEFNPVFSKKYCLAKEQFTDFLKNQIPQSLKTAHSLPNQSIQMQLEQIYGIIEKLAIFISGNNYLPLNPFSYRDNNAKPRLTWPHQELIFVKTYTNLDKSSDLFIFPAFHDSFAWFYTLIEPNISLFPLSIQKTLKALIQKTESLLGDFEDWKTSHWQKPKQIHTLSYVITLDRLQKLCSADFLDPFLKSLFENKAQLQEWKELLQFTPVNEIDFYTDPKKPSQFRPIPIDLKYFPLKVTSELFAGLSIPLQPSLLDGMIIKSDNYQALSLLQSQFGNRIKTIFIDPPFNKETDLCDSVLRYKVDYSDSIWLSLLSSRIKLGKSLLQENGSIFVRCDYAGNHLMRCLLNEIFGWDNFRNEIIVRRGAPKASLFKQFKEIRSVGVIYDNLYWYSKNINTTFKTFFKAAEEHQQHGKWCSFKKIYDRPNLRYEILGINLEKGQWMWNKDRAMKAVENYKRFQNKNPNQTLDLEIYWAENGSNEEYIRRQKDSIQYWVAPREKVLCDNNWMDIPGYASGRRFKTENSEELLERIISSTSEPGDWVMDFFLGSGTTAAVAHKLGRKWIGVEMGPQFEDVILPRMKQVLFGDLSGISKNVEWKGSGFFAYYTLEQFEDSISEECQKDTHEKDMNKTSLFPDLFNLSGPKSS